MKNIKNKAEKNIVTEVKKNGQTIILLSTLIKICISLVNLTAKPNSFKRGFQL